MAERRSVGDILVDFGRVSRAEVDQALTYQRERGGYFGEALVALGLVKQQELDWILATQFQIPYIVPDADEVDLAAVRLVTPQWALAHTALPILRTETTLTVLVSAPNREVAALEELRQRTGMTLTLAMSSPDTVRRVANEVFARLAVLDRALTAPLSVVDLWAAAEREGASGFGVSARGHSAWGWYEAGGRKTRHPLNSRWETDLTRMLSPAPAEVQHTGELCEWRADLEYHGASVPVNVTLLRNRGGTELVVHATTSVADAQRLSPPDPELVAELVRLVRNGGARVHVTARPAALLDEAAQHIPTLLLDDSLRAIHVTDHDLEATEGTLVLRLVEDADARAAQLAGLRVFEFDAITATLARPCPALAQDLARLAPSLFLACPGPWDPATLRGAGVTWELEVAANDWGRQSWRLRAARP